MNSSRDTKSASKAQKKQQKLVKKQQLQKTKVETEQMNKNQKNSGQLTQNTKNPVTANNNNNNIVNNNNNNINNNNNNNNNVNENNNNNVSQKLREYYEQQQLQKQLIKPNPLLAGAPKFERSGSFSLKGKLSKLINSITSSKESLNKIEDEKEVPFTFSRSRSMILPRRTNRRSLIEPQLEQLSEEDPMSPASPRKNSIETETIESTPQRPASMSAAPTTSTPIENHVIDQPRKTSTPVLGSEPAFDPIANFKKRRSSTLISSFKTTFGMTTEKKKEKLNNKWRASLQSLQAVDNMVSYENMSFIDYDKFNVYEKQLERKLSQISLMDPSINSANYPDSSMISDNSSYILASPCTPSNITAPSPFVTPQTVVRRRKTSASVHGSSRELAKRRSASRNSLSRNSFCVDLDYEHNLDKPRNVYRESLDSRKLELLNDMSRNSYILDSDLVDILDLASTPLTHAKRPHYKRGCSHMSTGHTKPGQDAVDGAATKQVSEEEFKLLKIMGGRGK